MSVLSAPINLGLVVTIGATIQLPISNELNLIPAHSRQGALLQEAVSHWHKMISLVRSPVTECV